MTSWLLQQASNLRGYRQDPQGLQQGAHRDQPMGRGQGLQQISTAAGSRQLAQPSGTGQVRSSTTFRAASGGAAGAGSRTFRGVR